VSRGRPDQRRRLRRLLGGVFIALLAAGLTLAWLGYRQLRFEAFYQQQTLAADLTGRIDRAAVELFAGEDARSFVDFSFLIVGEGNFVQRSPLSAFPPRDDVPGLVSYFQVDAEGGFSTPLLPNGDLNQAGEIEDVLSRRALENRVRTLLAAEQAPSRDDVAEAANLAGRAALAPAPATVMEEEAQGQKAYDRLNAPLAREMRDSDLGSVSELKLSEDFARREIARPASPEPPAASAVSEAMTTEMDTSALRMRRAERNLALAPSPSAPDADEATDALDGAPAAGLADAPLTIFESEVDPFRFDRLDGEHFVLHRTAWQDGRRYVQGAVIGQDAFLEALIGRLYREAGLATDTLVVAHQGDVLATYRGPGSMGPGSTDPGSGYSFRASDITGTLLYRARLTTPINDLELVFGFDELAVGPGGTVIAGTTALYLILLVGGFLLIYRVGVRQIELSEQQQDFVSAVSHELKTPLTSIRMYGEMLKAGWVSEEKRREYYDYIFSESERLTRLINNVLRLARLDRNGTELDMKRTSVAELVDLARSKIASQVSQAGFELEERHEAADGSLLVDADAFTQVLINLVDNALKFSRKAVEQKVVFGSRVDGDEMVFSVRDFGPGVPREQMRKIFELFYRTERELTRETVGTGIGLSLVNELVTAMGGRVDVRNAEPGAEFQVRLPLAASGS
jgi:signal transduction histidine kinase